MKFILASGNAHKKEEYEDLLSPHTGEIVEGFDADETGTTYKENARIKLNALDEFLKKQGKFDTLSPSDILFADDSGLEIESHREILGLYTSRFMSDVGATQSQKNDKIIKIMKTADNRNARFVCHIAFKKVKSDEILDVEGEIKGIIADSQDGDGGFGYDPIFIPNGESETLSKLGSKYKREHSHRANALSLMLKVLEQYN